MQSFELTPFADEDLTGIWRYSYETWGEAQADQYFDALIACCDAIGMGLARSKAVPGLSHDARVLRCEKHYIFFLPLETPVIFAVLHGKMDMLARLSDRL